MKLEKAIERLSEFANMGSLDGRILGITENQYHDIKESINTALQHIKHLQKENELAKKALIANSYEADEINTLLVKIQELQKENEELKKGNEVIDSFPLVRTVKR